MQGREDVSGIGGGRGLVPGTSEMRAFVMAEAGVEEGAAERAEALRHEDPTEAVERARPRKKPPAPPRKLRAAKDDAASIEAKRRLRAANDGRWTPNTTEVYPEKKQMDDGCLGL